MASFTEVKSTFEYQDRIWKSYWNGKTYNGTRYVTATSPTGSQAKITCSETKGISVGGAHSLDFARVALKSIGIQA